MVITAGGIEFGCDRGGSGDPVILVMGLGAPRLGWFPQFAVLSQSYDVVTFDNRGVGETKATAPWTIQDNAADVIAIADAYGFERFHLAGISMGGMISQEVVLSSPERVRSVTLMSTSPGGPEAQMMTPEFQQALAEPDPARRMRVVAEATFGRKFRTEHPEMMEMILTGMESGAAGVIADRRRDGRRLHGAGDGCGDVDGRGRGVRAPEGDRRADARPARRRRPADPAVQR